jgi:hypothetical protein
MNQKPVVPTREEVLAAGYAEAAVDPIIARQEALLAEWLAANPSPDPIKVAVKASSERLIFNCPGCGVEISLEASGMLAPIVQCECGCVMELVNGE